MQFLISANKSKQQTMKKLAYLLIVFVFFIVSENQAQSEYKSAVGLRVGIPVSASFKHFINTAGAFEIHSGFWRDPVGYGFSYFRVGAMYQHHFPIGDIDGFKWYIGGGAFAEFYNYDNGYINEPSSSDIGLHAVGGVDYKFREIPLNVSADWMPTVFLGSGPYGFRGSYFGVAARYTFR